MCVGGGGCIVTELLSYCSNDQLLIHFLSVMLPCDSDPLPQKGKDLVNYVYKLCHWKAINWII